MRSTWPWLLLAACFDASPLVGVPCDPAAPSCPDRQACVATATGFACLPVGTPPVIDAPMIDGPMIDTPIAVPCPGDPGLLVCFAFDDPVLASPLANEGRVPESADLVDVTPIANGTGGAAQLGDTSSILIPANTTLADIVFVEASIRLDAAVPDGTRIGIIDADATTPGMSVFIFGRPDGHQLRCAMGDTNLFADVPIVPGAWISLACRCEADLVSAYADGVKLAEAPGCEPSLATTFGLQIGQNNRAGTGLPPNEHLIGAIDDVRVWSALP